MPPTSRVTQIFDSYASKLEDWLIRVERATDEGRNNTYSSDKWMSDVITTLSDATDFWYLPYKICDARDRIVEFAITTADDGATEAISIPDPGTTPVTISNLTHASVAGATIPAAKVAVFLVQNRRTLVVQLSGLIAIPTIAGTYTGSISTSPTTKVAGIKVTVT